MATYAIVETGGKQYRVEEGQSLLVDRLPADEGSKVTLRPVMFRNDSDTVLDAKQLEKVKVEAKVAGHERGKKIKVFKYKAKKGYRKHQGHRSELTRLEVTGVKLAGGKPAKKAEKADEGSEAEVKTAAAKKPAAEKKAPAKPKATPKPKAPKSDEDGGEAKAEKAEKKPAAEKKPTAEKKPAAEKKKPAKKDPKPDAAAEKATEKTEEATD